MNIKQLLYWVINMSKGLVTNYGEGATKREGGQMELYPRGGGAEKVLAMLKGGYEKFWGSFYAVT